MEGGGRRGKILRDCGAQASSRVSWCVTYERLGRTPLVRAQRPAELEPGFRGCSCGRRAHGSRTHSRAKLSADVNRAQLGRAEYGFKVDL